jgi:hypothetical protein
MARRGKRKPGKPGKDSHAARSRKRKPKSIPVLVLLPGNRPYRGPKHKDPWDGKPELGPFDRPLEQQDQFALAYTRKWHAVHDWAMEASLGDVTLRNGDPRRRSAEGLLVRNIEDDEEAAERGCPLEKLENLPNGPNKAEGGHRRVVIRLLTWLWDVRNQSAYQPQWGTFGTGMSARAATDSFRRYVRSYQDAVARGIESRRMIVTGMSIVWWTSDPRELNYV